MPTVEIDIDFCEFEDYDIIREAVDRIKKMKRSAKFFDTRMKEAIEGCEEELNDLAKVIGLSFDLGIETPSIDDEAKMKYLKSIFAKYTFDEIKAALP